MYILVLMVITAVICIVVIKNVDQRRWQRYQIERDLFFRDHPYVLKSEPDFNVRLNISKPIQIKLINNLMLKTSTPHIFKKAVIQREQVTDHQAQKYLVKVMVEDIKVGYLEQHYAEHFCESLKKSDFFIGRPISVLSEVTLCKNRLGESGCRVILSLPEDPKDVKDLLQEKNEA